MIDQMDVLNGYQARIDRQCQISMMHVRQWVKASQRAFLHSLHFCIAALHSCMGSRLHLLLEHAEKSGGGWGIYSSH